MKFVDGQIAFVEFPARTLSSMRRFYGAAFGWGFAWPIMDHEGDYVAFRGMGAEGGFSAHPTHGPVEPLVVLYARDLEAALAKVRAAGGEITREIFVSRGGRRFQFRDPGENEVAVWSDTFPGPVAVKVRQPQPIRPFAFWWNWGALGRPMRRPAAPAAPSQPQAVARLELTHHHARSRTKQEHRETPGCARMARSTT
jgi:predicted enzyme related to lactoylglutathione lyase